jgi:hypothetical protein
VAEVEAVPVPVPAGRVAAVARRTWAAPAVVPARASANRETRAHPRPPLVQAVAAAGAVWSVPEVAPEERALMDS